jgi:hypothetical protein
MTTFAAELRCGTEGAAGQAAAVRGGLEAARLAPACDEWTGHTISS